MSTSTIADKYESKSEIVEINLPDEDKKEKKSDSKHSLFIMTAISLLVMIVAVSLIYYFIKTDPTLVHNNDQTSQVSENDSYVNPNSIQKLEHDDSHFTMKPAENSQIFIVCGAAFMVVMVGAFIFVKVAEHKEDN